MSFVLIEDDAACATGANVDPKIPASRPAVAKAVAIFRLIDIL